MLGGSLRGSKGHVSTRKGKSIYTVCWPTTRISRVYQTIWTGFIVIRCNYLGKGKATSWIFLIQRFISQAGRLAMLQVFVQQTSNGARNTEQLKKRGRAMFGEEGGREREREKKTYCNLNLVFAFNFIAALFILDWTQGNITKTQNFLTGFLRLFNVSLELHPLGIAM